MKSAAARELVSYLRQSCPVLAPQTDAFRRLSFGVMVRVSRATAAWSKKDRGETLARLDDLFAYLGRFEGTPTPEETRAVMRRNPVRPVVSETTLPILLTKYVMDRVRIDMSAVPSFAPWAERYQEAILAA